MSRGVFQLTADSLAAALVFQNHITGTLDIGTAKDRISLTSAVAFNGHIVRVDLE